MKEEKKSWSGLELRAGQGIREAFPYEPTPDQDRVIDALAIFMGLDDPDEAFVLKGYAGTGKTTLVSAIVAFLESARFRAILLAPTGRAAKVLSTYSVRPASTIHREIYMLKTRADGTPYLTRKPNKHKHTLFIVDEASMIPGRPGDEGFRSPGDKSLLEDLIDYVRYGHHCKLLFIGDHAQLPPVGLLQSPALDTSYLRMVFGLEARTMELTQVVRQAFDSKILKNATFVRDRIRASNYELPLFSPEAPDVIRMGGHDLEDALHSTIGNDPESAVFITRSNRRANQFNHEIRRRILWREEELNAGDLLMVVRNNYYWLDDKAPAGFIANGDIVEVLSLHGSEEIYECRFADATVRMIDYPNQGPVQVKLLLDTIDSESPSLTLQENRRLFQLVMADYAHLGSKFARTEAVRNDKYYNALQVKFAYAMTCHKTQGGQWENVFVEQGYFRHDHLDEELFRWIYTAVTRATKRLYLVNFIDDFYY